MLFAHREAKRARKTVPEKFGRPAKDKSGKWGVGIGDNIVRIMFMHM